MRVANTSPLELRVACVVPQPRTNLSLPPFLHLQRNIQAHGEVALRGICRPVLGMNGRVSLEKPAGIVDTAVRKICPVGPQLFLQDSLSRGRGVEEISRAEQQWELRPCESGYQVEECKVNVNAKQVKAKCSKAEQYSAMKYNILLHMDQLSPVSHRGTLVLSSSSRKSNSCPSS